MEGADTKSVSVCVDPRGPGTSWSEEGAQWGEEPRREQFYTGNWSSAAASLVILAKVTLPPQEIRSNQIHSHTNLLLPVSCQVVHAQSVVLEWKLYPSRGASFGGLTEHNSPLPLPRWTSAVVHIDNAQISYTAKVGRPRSWSQCGGSCSPVAPDSPAPLLLLQVPADVQEYNLTHLLPATHYHICLTVSSSPTPPPSSAPSPAPPLPSSPLHTSCLNVTTREAGFSVELMASRRGSVALAAVMGSMFALSIMALLVVYMGRRVQQHKTCGHSLKIFMQHATSIPLNELYPPLITLWESEAEKDKDDKEEEEVGRQVGGRDEEEAGGSQINTTKTYMW